MREIKKRRRGEDALTEAIKTVAGVDQTEAEKIAEAIMPVVMQGTAERYGGQIEAEYAKD